MYNTIDLSFMSQYYNPNPSSRKATEGQGRTKKLYDKNSKDICGDE